MRVLNESVYLSESQCPRLEKEGFGLDSGHGPRDPNVAPLYYENMWRKGYLWYEFVRLPPFLGQ